MLNQTQTKEIEKLFEIGAHLGHKKNRLDPKARKNVYKIENGTSIIDLTKTIAQLEKAHAFLKETAQKGESILVVGTKKVASSLLKELCVEKNVPYMTSKWLPGLLTNFGTLNNNVKKLTTLKQEQASGAWDSLVKHERMALAKEISKLERLYSGLESLPSRPHVLVVVDPKKEKNAVKEAQTFKIPVVALADTNTNPETLEYPVVANDDASEVVQYIMSSLLSSYADNFVAAPKKPAVIQEVQEN
jgi:small subunit ribosomal protein S2